MRQTWLEWKKAITEVPHGYKEGERGWYQKLELAISKYIFDCLWNVILNYTESKTFWTFDETITVFLSIHLSTHPSMIHPNTNESIHLSVHPYMYPSTIHTSIHLSITLFMQQIFMEGQLYVRNCRSVGWPGPVSFHCFTTKLCSTSSSTLPHDLMFWKVLSKKQYSWSSS